MWDVLLSHGAVITCQQKMENEKEVFNGNRISLYDYKDEKGNDAVIIQYGTAKIYIWDEDFEELIHGINFVRSKSNAPRGDFYK